ncbi:MAG: AAA family ATPase [Leptolyngbyaceae cyanobacterium]
MKNIIVKTANLTRLKDSYDEITSIVGDDPRMAVLHGFAGAGKTTGVRQLALQHGDLFLRASCTWTPTALLGDLAHELRLECGRSRSHRLRAIKEAMDINPRTLFLDDADQLFNVGSRQQVLVLFETLREIHDEAQMPIFFVGMENFAPRLREWEQLARRVVDQIEFEPLDLIDAIAIARQRCEVVIADDLIEELHTHSGGSCGRITNGLRAIERYGKQCEIDPVTLSDWKASDRKFYLDLAKVK